MALKPINLVIKRFIEKKHPSIASRHAIYKDTLKWRLLHAPK